MNVAAAVVVVVTVVVVVVVVAAAAIVPVVNIHLHFSRISDTILIANEQYCASIVLHTLSNNMRRQEYVGPVPSTWHFNPTAMQPQIPLYYLQWFCNSSITFSTIPHECGLFIRSPYDSVPTPLANKHTVPRKDL
jgi:hypothetical protein